MYRVDVARLGGTSVLFRVEIDDGASGLWKFDNVLGVRMGEGCIFVGCCRFEGGPVISCADTERTEVNEKIFLWLRFSFPETASIVPSFMVVAHAPNDFIGSGK